jgi:hypothetical protein
VKQAASSVEKTADLSKIGFGMSHLLIITQ